MIACQVNSPVRRVALISNYVLLTAGCTPHIKCRAQVSLSRREVPPGPPKPTPATSRYSASPINSENSIRSLTLIASPNNLPYKRASWKITHADIFRS
ncbi:hypothetical protein Zmor_009421 [Zophobas morio]|uniref:Uncharacterized protein n=1 Tax=Zophobas morio TaxID=2755281 RepID=A0AA38IMH1_9CUCU|nr:hypothetical protein Zmor_009421 [Zophobas morio]